MTTSISGPPDLSHLNLNNSNNSPSKTQQNRQDNIETKSGGAKVGSPGPRPTHRRIPSRGIAPKRSTGVGKHTRSPSSSGGTILAGKKNDEKKNGDYCVCGKSFNKKKFCIHCGAKRPAAGPEKKAESPKKTDNIPLPPPPAQKCVCGVVFKGNNPDNLNNLNKLNHPPTRKCMCVFWLMHDIDIYNTYT